jgi:Protein of unknown function (DUF3443)
MNGARFVFVAALPLFAFGCSGAGGGSDVDHADAGPADASTSDARPSDGRAASETGATDGRSETSADAPGPASNVVPMIVNAGPPGVNSYDAPFVSITVCMPGTMNCETIDDIEVDTGASGVRVLASALTGLALPQQTASDGSPLVECMQYTDGYSWGPVKLADVRIGSKLAASIPIEVIADPMFTSVPNACSNSGPSENTLTSFGSYGTIGINQIVPDCGPSCASTKPVHAGGYYSCTGSTCTPVAVPEADQVSNPIAAFTSDNNGAVLQFPTVPADGATTLSGSLIFGIGTAGNNALGSATVLTVDENSEFTTVFDGITMPGSYIDSGTEYLWFYDSSLRKCKASSTGGGFYCPASPQTLTAENVGENGATSNVTFTVANANSLFSDSSYAVFDDVGSPGPKASFAWGFPFFLGRSVFVALGGATTPGGDGPYVAY